MLQQLHLSNFKSFRNFASVQLAPLTLIYGGNSGGKSTLIQALILLKQSLDSAAAPGSPLIFASDSYLDLGNFQNVVSDHDISRRVTLGIVLDEAKFVLRRMGPGVKAALSNAGLHFVFSSTGTGGTNLTSLELRLDAVSRPAATYSVSRHKLSRDELMRLAGPRLRRSRSVSLSAETVLLELVDLDLESDLVTAAYEHFMSSSASIRDTLAAPERLDFPEIDESLSEDIQVSTLRRRVLAHRAMARHWLERLKRYDKEMFTADLLRFSKGRLLLLDRFVPTAPLTRSAVSNDISGFDEISLNALMSNYRGTALLETPIIDIAQIIASMGFAIEDEFEHLTYVGPLREFPERNYIFSAGGEKTVGLRGENLPGILFSRPDRIDELNRLANLMQLGYEISVYRSLDPELDNVFAVRLIDQVTKARVGISDVGFGVSQVLPILLQCALRERGCIVIEQPEIHLNPRLQASMAEVFASSVTRGRRQLIIETHSEHLLLRLQRLIREGRFDSTRLSVLYVSKASTGSAVMPIEIAKNGDRLTAWPDGFFDDTYRELFEGVK